MTPSLCPLCTKTILRAPVFAHPLPRTRASGESCLRQSPGHATPGPRWASAECEASHAGLPGTPGPDDARHHLGAGDSPAAPAGELTPVRVPRCATRQRPRGAGQAQARVRHRRARPGLGGAEGALRPLHRGSVAGQGGTAQTPSSEPVAVASTEGHPCVFASRKSLTSRRKP